MEFSDAQLHTLIDEWKQRNTEYHVITNKKKYHDIAKKINDQENTNYFTSEEYHKKFLSLMKAFYVSSAGWTLCLCSTKTCLVNILFIL